MKDIFILFLLVFIMKSNAQQRYETFVVKDKYCIVDLETMTQLKTFVYTSEEDDYVDVLCMAGNGFVDFYDKREGFLKRFNNENPDIVRLNDEKYFCFYGKKNSYLIPNYYSEKIILPKQYIDFVSKQNFLICKSVNDYYDIYDATNLSQLLLENLVANNYLFKEVKGADVGETIVLHVFYGKEKTYFFDSDFKLIKENLGVSDYFDVKEMILQNYTIIEEDLGLIKGVSVDKSVDAFYVHDSKSITITKEVPYVISANDYYSWSFVDLKNTLLLTNYDRNEQYEFKIDFINKRFLLPNELKEKIGLEFIE